MSEPIIYKDKEFFLEFIFEPIHSKLYNILIDNIENNMKIYRFGIICKKDNKINSIDIYLDDSERKLLFGCLYNTIKGLLDSLELDFCNKINENNFGYYKIAQFINNKIDINFSIKLKIYRDKNFVIIEPKISCSYFPIISTDLGISIYPILLSENKIKEIESNCK